MVRWLATVLLLLGSVPAVPAETNAKLRTDTFNSSAVCGTCHVEIYAMWQRSMHSAALTDPIFEASFLRAYWETRGEAAKVCLECHAPVASVTKDWALSNPITREGITCDFCHSVVSVDLERQDGRFQVVHDGVKRGPLAEAVSPSHAIAKSDLHQSSEFCAGCHEYINDHGVTILGTFTEWKTSPQAKAGKTCQYCHMPFTPGETVRAGVRTVRRKAINLHDISGMHSTEQVRKAATAKIVGVERKEPNHVEVKVEVANVGSGHSIPTGLPTRKLVLEVAVFAGEYEIRRFEREYQKVLEDDQGRVIVQDHRAMLSAVRIREDNRLRPGEKRIESFVTELPVQGRLRAEAHLRYVYEAERVSETPITIDIASDRFDGSR